MSPHLQIPLSISSFQYVYIYAYDSICYVCMYMTSNIECDVLHGSKPEDCMPPWVAQVLSLVVWGSQNSWFGLSCPAHCNSSLLLHLVVFLSGLSCGALIALIALWSFGLLPLGFRDSNLPARRPPSLRLLSYLHERSARWGCQDRDCNPPLSCQYPWERSCKGRGHKLCSSCSGFGICSQLGVPI